MASRTEFVTDNSALKNRINFAIFLGKAKSTRTKNITDIK